MKLVIKLMGIVAFLGVILNSLMYLIKGVKLPLLTEVSICMLMVNLIYGSKQQFDKGSMSKGHYLFIFIVGGIGIILSLFVIIKNM